jgi:hypothetical protein
MINLFTQIFNEAFLDKWQTLIGAAAGPFLAIILSAIGFWVRSKYVAWKERKEAIRQIEVSIARSMNDMYRTQQELIYFVERVKNLVSTGQRITDDRTYLIDETNFPHLKEIFADSSLPILKIKSYYIHNKLLVNDMAISATNHMLNGLKASYSKILDNNKFLIALRQNPSEQRNTYLENLTGFANTVEGDVLSSITNGLKALMETKLYNLKLMKHPIFTVWKYEGKSFKFFKDKDKLKKYSGNLDALDALDKLFDKDVKQALNKAEERGRNVYQVPKTSE